MLGTRRHQRSGVLARVGLCAAVALASVGAGLVSAPPAEAQAGCSLQGETRIVRPRPGYHFVLLEGRVRCSRGVGTKITENIRHERTGIPDENVASKQWKATATGGWQTYQVGVDCTAGRRGQTFHGDIYVNYWVGVQGATLHKKTNTVKC